MTYAIDITPEEDEEMACCHDPETDFGMEPGVSPTVDNAALWSAAIFDPATYFRSVDMGGRIWYFDTPMLVNRSARRITGTGHYHHGNVYDSPSDHIRYGTPTIIAYNGTALSFNGTSVTATTSGASAVIALTGHTVTAEDVGINVVITGGTNFIFNNPSPAGTWDGDTYVVLAVNVGANSWTLDRNCTTGSGSGMTGYATHVLVSDASAGTNWDGFYISGRTLANATGGKYYSPGGAGGPRAYAGMQLVPQYSGGPAAGANPGKTRIVNTVFSGCEVGLLIGRDGRGAHDQFSSYTGSTDAHGDYITLDHCWFKENRTGILIRQSQAVHFQFRRIKFDVDHETCFYFERGGFSGAYGVELGGAGGWTLARLGRFSSADSGYYRFNDVRTDAQTTTSPIKMLTTDAAAIHLGNTLHQIVFDGGQIAQGNGFYEDVAGFTGLFDVVGGQNVVVSNWKNFQDKIFRMRGSNNVNPRKPHATLVNCQLADEGISQLTDVVDWDNSEPGTYGWRVDVINCVDHEGNYWNGTVTEADAP